MMDIKEINERIQRESAFVDLLQLELGKVIVGQKQMTERLLIALLANGHILLEGVLDWPRRFRSSRLHQPFTPSSTGSNSHRTCYLPT